MDNALDKRLNELALRTRHTGDICFTRFLEPSAMGEVNAAAVRAGVKAAFWGGYAGAERCAAAFYGGDPPEAGDWPVVTLRLQWNGRFANPGHRDLLGALMGLGIGREMTGDIAMGEYRGAPCAYLFALREVADYIAANLESAGRAALKVSATDQPPTLSPPQGESLRLTVQQQRLDAVLAAACRLSRTEAQRLIAAGLVKLNHVLQLRPDARLSEGDMISARGYGRVRVTAFQGESRRGRQIVQVFRYGEPRKN